MAFRESAKAVAAWAFELPWHRDQVLRANFWLQCTIITLHRSATYLLLATWTSVLVENLRPGFRLIT